ncbi:MAG: hypothetical protein JWM98_2422 [Thermoleophilia bacterium]|nr:hypothetical protein [Thermoleophilia bacterium]
MRPRLLLRALLVVIAVIAIIPTAASGATVIDPLVISSDPTEDELVTLQVSGSSDTARTLYVLHLTGTAACPSSQTGYTALVPPAGSSTVGPGTYTRTYEFTPTSAGDHTICLYLSDGYYSTPTATRRTVIPVRLPATSIDPMNVSADPTEDEQVTLTVTGSSEAARTLYVLHLTGTATCPSSQTGYSALTPTTGTSNVGPGAYTRTYEFTPTNAGDHTICSYVSEGYYDTPLATRRTVIPVRLPATSIDPMNVSADPTAGEPVTVTITGSSEAARTLYVLHVAGTATCPSSQTGYSALAPRTGSSAVGPGAFARSYEFTSAATENQTICAYVSEGYYDAPLATRTGSVAVSLPRASVTPSGVSAAYRAGETRDMQLTVSSQHASSLAYRVTASGSATCAGTKPTVVPVPAGASTQVISHTFGRSAYTTICWSVAGAVSSATSSVRLERVAAAFSLVTPADKTVIRNGRPVLVWSDDTDVAIPTRVTVATHQEHDATGALAAPLVLTTSGCVADKHEPSGCSPIKLLTTTPASPLAAGTYYWTVSWRDPTTGAIGHTATRRFIVPPKRAIVAIAAVISRTRDRNAVVRVRYHDNVDRHRLVVSGYVGRRRVFTRSVVAGAVTTVTTRVVRVRLGGAVADGQHVRLVATVSDRRGHASRTSATVVPILPKPKPRPRPTPPASDVGDVGGGSSGGGGSGDLNCSDVGHQVDTSNGDPNGLDGDNDGVGCESYPGPPTSI